MKLTINIPDSPMHRWEIAEVTKGDGAEPTLWHAALVSGGSVPLFADQILVSL